MTNQQDEPGLREGKEQQSRSSADLAATQRAVFAQQSETPTVALREQLYIHEVLKQIACAMLPPREVVEATCRQAAPLFAPFHLGIAVHFPETHLFAIYAHGCESKRVVCEETIEGYFLHEKSTDILVIEDCASWTPPPPLDLTRWSQEEKYRGGLFVASRVRENLIGVLSLQSEMPFAWDAREIEMLRAVAAGFGLTYYYTVLCDNLMYSCRETSQRLVECQKEIRQWQDRVEQVQAAMDIAHAVGGCESIADLFVALERIFSSRWSDCRVTIQRYLQEKDVFETSPIWKPSGEIVRPARNSVLRLFLSNVPVTHILCDSPQEIASYRDLDPDFVAECEREGFRSFCSAPIYTSDDHLWGAITLQGREPGICELRAELLVETGRALIFPIQAVELRERILDNQRAGASGPPSHPGG